MSLYSESKQLYFSFVYDEYMHKHSEFNYLLDLINQIDWSVELVILVTLYLKLCSFKRLNEHFSFLFQQ